MLRWSPTLGVACAIVATSPGAPNAGAARQETFEPLVTTLGTRAYDGGFDLWYYVSVVFESRVEVTDEGFEYQYRLTWPQVIETAASWCDARPVGGAPPVLCQ